jgi:hypothetical protein
VPAQIRQFDAAFYEDDNASVNSNTVIDSGASSISRRDGVADRVVLRISLEEYGAGAGPSAQDFQLWVSKNGGSYAQVTASHAAVRPIAAQYTDGDSTTQRLSDPGRTWDNGVADDVDAVVSSHSIANNRFTELCFCIWLYPGGTVPDDTLDFQVRSTDTDAWSVTPRITRSASVAQVGTSEQTQSSGQTGTFAGTVPATADIVALMAVGYDFSTAWMGSNDFSLGGTGNDFTQVQTTDGQTDNGQVWLGYILTSVSGTGSKTFAWDHGQAPDEGMTYRLVYYDGVDTAAVIRDSANNTVGADISGLSPVSAGDMTTGLAYAYNQAPDGNISSQTEIANGTYNSAGFSFVEKDGSAALSWDNESFSTGAAMVIKQSAAAGGGIALQPSRVYGPPLL